MKRNNPQNPVLKSVRNTGLLFLFCITVVWSQTYPITGRVYDESGKKIGPARIIIYNLDKKLVDEIETGNNGKFKFKEITAGNYTMNLYVDGGYSATLNINVGSDDLESMEPALTLSEDQPQVQISSEVGGAKLNWDLTPGAVEYIIYRNNDEIGRVTETNFLDKVEPGKTFSYNITAVKSDGASGTRSITEFGKSLLGSPNNPVAGAQQNIIKLGWDALDAATSYNIYRDDDLINTTSDNSFSDFKLKYDREYIYRVVGLDHHGDEGEPSENIIIRTHPEVVAPDDFEAEAGENLVNLSWETVDHAVKYLVYLNGALIDSTENAFISIPTEPGTDNCFSVAGVDQYGSEGAKSDPACDKSVFSPPDSIVITNEMNVNTIRWAEVEGADSYNIYRDDKLVTNTGNLTYQDKGLDWDQLLAYHITSLTSDGQEGPNSQVHEIKVPAIFIITGILKDESGDEDNIDQAKVFLYTDAGELKDEYTVRKNGKFKFEKEIISGEYTIKAYGNGNGNGGKRITINEADLNDINISLSTKGLRPTLKITRGTERLTLEWNDYPQMKSYNIYKNGKKFTNIVNELSYVDQVAPGNPITYDVRTVDVYDLEGPPSNEITETSAYMYPELSYSVISGGYSKEGSGRHVNITWQPVAGVEQYALYRDGNLITKLSETTYLDSTLEWGKQYNYQINSIDADQVEGVNSPNFPVETHSGIQTPNVEFTPQINSIKLEWDVDPVAVNYKVYRNGNNIADTKNNFFIDNVKPGIEYCYTVAAEDEYATVGNQAEVQCGKAFYAPPANFTGTVDRNEVHLKWNLVSGATGYKLYINNEEAFSTEDETEFLADSLEYYTDYLLEIASHDQDGLEGPRAQFNTKTHEEVLRTSLTVDSDLEKVSLNWIQSELETEHRYRIYRDGEMIDETQDTIYSDFAPAGQFYCYGVTVIDSYGTESPLSNEECKKILVSPPNGLEVTGDVKRVIFEWRFTVGAKTYNIYSVDKNTETRTLLTTTKGNYFEHKDLAFDTEYCYQVSCVDIDGDEGPLSDIQCGFVLPPPHLTLIEKTFVEGSGNKLLDGREHGWIIAKVVNDGRSPARELKPWLEPVGEAVTPSLKIDSVEMIPKLDVGDTLNIRFPIYAKLKIESGDRNFNIHVNEYTGLHLEPEPISFTTLAIIPPKLDVVDFAIDTEFGLHYIPKNEIATLTVRIQNLSDGKSDTSSVRFYRDSTFVSEDKDELFQYDFINAHESMDFAFEVMSREDQFTVYFELYDYFGTRKTIPLHLKTMKQYKGADELITLQTPYPETINIAPKVSVSDLSQNIPLVDIEREAIGIVLGNPEFWEPSISGHTSTESDVKIVREYFKQLYGMDNHSIVPSQYWFFNDGISSRDFQAIFDPDLGYIRKKIESKVKYSGIKSLDIILYYSGEGTTHNGEKVLIPFDADPSNDYSFFTLNELYENLSGLQRLREINDITLFMDVDFNHPAFAQHIKSPEPPADKGSKKKKKKKKKGKEEPVVVAPSVLEPPPGITAFYASTTEQLSYDHPDADNGIFTYYLLKGLRGEADNGDKEVTVSELHEYISKQVSDTTSKLYKSSPQVPQLFSTNPDKVLYRLP